MAVERELIVFSRPDTAAVLAQLAALADGSWINIEPVVDDEDLAEARAHEPHPLLRIFSTRGRAIPFGTVVAASDGLSVGLEHGRGTQVVRQLKEFGIRVPASWEQEQDHPRRGIVYTVPRDEQPEVLLTWILDAATALADVPIRGRWTAVVACPSR